MMAAIYDWSGFYIGLNGGGGWSHKCWIATRVLGGDHSLPLKAATMRSGGVVGGQIGYRWQSGAWVFGLEAQGDWADLKGSNTSLFVLPGGGPNCILACAPVTTGDRSRIDGFGLFTGQVGYAWNSVLWYVKGGGAVVADRYTGFFTGYRPRVRLRQRNPLGWHGRYRSRSFSFAPNWSVAVEYDHLFMGTRTLDFNSIITPALVLPRTTASVRTSTWSTVRINYRWGGPVIAKY